MKPALVTLKPGICSREKPPPRRRDDLRARFTR
jgi:hypothetical protein